MGRRAPAGIRKVVARRRLRTICGRLGPADNPPAACQESLAGHRAERAAACYLGGPAENGLHTEAQIDSLTSKQRAFLRSSTHGLKPVVQIGKGGVSEAAVAAVSEALTTRELIKVKVLDVAPVSAVEAGAALSEALSDAQLVQTIGRTIVLYRPDPEAPEIDLPS